MVWLAGSISCSSTQWVVKPFPCSYFSYRNKNKCIKTYPSNFIQTMFLTSYIKRVLICGFEFFLLFLILEESVYNLCPTVWILHNTVPPQLSENTSKGMSTYSFINYEFLNNICEMLFYDWPAWIWSDIKFIFQRQTPQFWNYVIEVRITQGLKKLHSWKKNLTQPFQSIPWT